MSERISTLSLYNNSTRNVMNVYKRLENITSQLGAEETIKDFASLQNSNDIQISLNINKEVQAANTYIRNVLTVEMRTQQMDRSIENILEIAIYLNGEMSRSTHSIDNEQLRQIAEQKLDEIKNELNANIGSAYIFSGSMVSTSTVNDITDPSSYYQGGNIINSAQISDTIELEYGVIGNNEAFQQLIITTNLATKVGDNKQTLNEAKSFMEKAISNLINLQQKIRNDYASANNQKQTRRVKERINTYERI